jgi:hypothetical protein
MLRKQVVNQTLLSKLGGLNKNRRVGDRVLFSFGKRL